MTEHRTASTTWTPRPPRWIWMDGRFLDVADANVSVLSHGLHYGTGVFEGIRAYSTPEGPRIFALAAHLERLRRGADLLGLTVDVESLAWACEEVLARNGLDAAYIRPLVVHGAGGLGLDLGGQRQHTIVAAMPWRSHLGGTAATRGVRATIAVTSALRRNRAAAIPPLKLTGGYVNAVLAKRAAAAAGFEEAIFIDDRDRVCEATGENVFAVFGDRVVAAAHADALPGITRRVVLELADGEERELSLAELLAADEVFLTGTSAEVTPVCEIDGARLAAGPVTRRLQAAYQNVVHGRAARAAAPRVEVSRPAHSIPRQPPAAVPPASSAVAS